MRDMRRKGAKTSHPTLSPENRAIVEQRIVEHTARVQQEIKEKHHNQSNQEQTNTQLNLSFLERIIS